MINQKITAGSKNNLGAIIPHIVQTACSFQSAITFEVADKKVNAKSIMGVMALAGTDTSTIDVTVNGADETDAFKAITDLFQ